MRSPTPRWSADQAVALGRVFGRADRLAGLVAVGLELLDLQEEGAALLIEGERLIEGGISANEGAAEIEGAADGVGVVANEGEGNHGGRFSSAARAMAARPRIRTSSGMGVLGALLLWVVGLSVGRGASEARASAGSQRQPGLGVGRPGSMGRVK